MWLMLYRQPAAAYTFHPKDASLADSAAPRALATMLSDVRG